MSLYLSENELLAGVEAIKDSPKDHGSLEMIVIRPKENERLVLEECEVSAKLGVHGDFWAETWGEKPSGGSPHLDTQVAIMNSRCIALLAQEKSRWQLAGDQLYVDMDLSSENLPPGQRLRIGTVVLEITGKPHTGCELFAERFGPAATRFVNTKIGKQLHLRGIYARVVQDGLVKVGDRIIKI